MYEENMPFLTPKKSMGAGEEFLRWRLNPTELLDDIEHTLRNERVNATTNKYERIKVKTYIHKKVKLSDGTTKIISTEKIIDLPQKMSDEGIHSIRSMLYPSLSKIITLSNYDEEKISKQVLSIMFVVRGFLARNYKRFHIQKESFDEIKNAVIAPVVYANLLRASAAGERDGLDKNVQHTEIRHIGNDGAKMEYAR